MLCLLQVVWNNTFELGLATAVSTAHGLIIVARYNPGGAKGEAADFKKNILAKRKYDMPHKEIGFIFVCQVVLKCISVKMLESNPVQYMRYYLRIDRD